jgi:hypothetical protein
MAFNRKSVNLGNQFAHAAEVSRGEARENNSRSRDYFQIPANMKNHKWGAKEERFNILLAKNNESDDNNTGYKFYKSVPVHELPNMQDPKHPHRYPCLRIIGKPCPCCERKEQEDDGTKGGENWERIKPFIPKERILYYINPENTEDVLVHECAAKQKGEAAFPQRLMAQATAMSEGGMPIPFASPNEDGRIVKVNTAKDSFNGNEFYSASAVNFFPRRELPSDVVYNKCKPWNEILLFGTYEEMTSVMNGEEPKIQSNPAPQQNQSDNNFRGNTQQNQRFTQEPANTPQQNQGFISSPVNQPVRDFPNEAPAPTNSRGCPNGLSFGNDFETSRKCCNCNAYDACRESRKTN